VALVPASEGEKELMKVLDSVVKVHEEWGDRKNRHWARIKYVVREKGIAWYQERLRERGAKFELPSENHDVGARKLHHGWQVQENGKLAYGMYVECGRLIDRGLDAEAAAADARAGYGSTTANHEQMRSLVRELMESFDTKLMITPNQDLLFTDLDPAAKKEFEGRFARHKYGTRNGKAYSSLRLLSGACVGLPTCRLSYSDSEQFEPELIDELEQMGYGDVTESIGITGCERQCFRPATTSIGGVGQGPDLYMLKIGGSEDGRHQGIPLVEGEKLYMRQVPRAKVATVCAVLFDHHKANAKPGEDLGAYHRRLGVSEVLGILRTDPRTAELTKKGAPAQYIPEENELPGDVAKAGA
jgi:sulfite reductase (NADPH) hemoprotein beta-component